MTTPMFTFEGPERKKFADRWRTVKLADGRVLQVGILQGKRKRIMYKPRGKNIGYEWYADVRDEKGRTVWSGRCSKSSGVRGILSAAGLLGDAALLRGRKTITFSELKRLQMVCKTKGTYNMGGRSCRDVGIGMVDEGPATPDDTVVTEDDGTLPEETRKSLVQA